MNVLVCGMGLQGKAVVHDLEQWERVDEIIVAELDPASARDYLSRRNYRKSRIVGLDADRDSELEALVGEVKPDAVVCMLPPQFGYRLAQIALEFGIPFVSSSYAGEIAGLDGEARRRGVVILPEMGMDPGIDLILARAAIDELDTVYGLYSYGTGLPEPDCAGDNPLGYKITWTFEGVLKSYCRPARFLKDGEEVRLPGEDIFMEEHGHMVEMTGLGPLEAYPNGDAIHFIEAFDLGPGIRDMGRFALRYPGHRRFWLTMSRLGFLDDTPVTIDGASVSPRRFLVHHLTPRLQFGDRERDVAALRVKAWGVKDGRDVSVTHDLADYRDPDTGLFAMNRMVGFTTSIGVQMILSGVITTPGVLSPARHVPPGLFLEQLEARGMRGERRVEREGDS